MQKNLVRKGLVLGIIVLFVGSGVVPTISGTDRDTIYVDDNNTEGPWNGTPEYPYQHIQDGIDAANPGDTVFVYSGTYTEYVHINKQINLIGQNRDTTVINNTDLGLGTAVVYVSTANADNTKVDSFTICSDNGAKRGIVMSNSDEVYITNCNIHNCIHGILLQSSDDCRIINCDSHHNKGGDDRNGMRLVGPSNGNLIMNSNFYDNGRPGDILCDGIDFEEAATGNTIVNCTFYNNQDDGISIDSSNNIIMNCTSYNNGGAGIFLINNVNNEIVNCNLYDNNYGIYLFRSTNNNISGNSIADNKQVGVYLQLWCNENNIRQNNFLNNTKDAFFFTSALNKWSWNYWDEARVLPKPIFGIMGIIPWVNFDWHPAKEPYDIPRVAI